MGCYCKSEKWYPCFTNLMTFLGRQPRRSLAHLLAMLWVVLAIVPRIPRLFYENSAFWYDSGPVRKNRFKSYRQRISPIRLVNIVNIPTYSSYIRVGEYPIRSFGWPNKQIPSETTQQMSLYNQPQLESVSIILNILNDWRIEPEFIISEDLKMSLFSQNQPSLSLLFLLLSSLPFLLSLSQE